MARHGDSSNDSLLASLFHGHGHAHKSGNAVIGIALTVLSTLVLAGRLVAEEFALRGTSLHPLQVLGYEGMWGTILVGISLPIVWVIPGSDVGEPCMKTATMIMIGSLIKHMCATLETRAAIIECAGEGIQGSTGLKERHSNCTPYAEDESGCYDDVGIIYCLARATYLHLGSRHSCLHGQAGCQMKWLYSAIQPCFRTRIILLTIIHNLTPHLSSNIWHAQGTARRICGTQF